MSRREPSGAASGRMTTWQVLLLLITIGASEESTAVNRLLGPLAGRDVWIALALALPLTMLGILAIVGLSGRHPGREFSALLRRLLGPLAVPLAVVYILLFIASAAQSAAEFTALSHLLFTSTPPSAFILPLVAVAIFTAWSGIEVAGRVNAALLLFVDIPLGIGLSLLFVGQEHVANLLPVLANGWPPVLRATQLVVGTWAQFAMLLVYLPSTVDPGRAGRASMWALLILWVMALGHNVGPVLVFGDAVGRFTWPVFSEIRVIDIGHFVERLDVIGIWLWVHGYWIQLTVFLHAAALMSADLLRLRSPRPLLLPLGVAVWLLALAVPNQDLSMLFRWSINAVAFPVLGFVVPALLLAWSAARRRRRPASRAQAAAD